MYTVEVQKPFREREMGLDWFRLLDKTACGIQQDPSSNLGRSTGNHRSWGLDATNLRSVVAVT